METESSPAKIHSINFLQRHSQAIKTLEPRKIAQLSYMEGFEDASKILGQPVYLGGPQWFQNESSKYNYFTHGTLFLVYTEVYVGEEFTPSYDFIYADCSGDHMALKYCYTGEEFESDWDDVLRFCVIEGKAPTEEYEGEQDEN